MIKYLIILSFLLIQIYSIAQIVPGKTGDKTLLPNGWSLTPAGTSLPLGDLPLNIVESSSRKYLAVTNNGQSTQTIQLIDIKNEKILDEVIIKSSWYGLQFSHDEKMLYASGGNSNMILEYSIITGKLILKDSIILGDKWPNKISPAGIAIDDDSKKLYVVTKDNNSLYVIDLPTKKIKKQISIGEEGYTCLLSPSNKQLYISVWGGEKVLVYITSSQVISDSIQVGSNPNEMCLARNGKYLFVANSNDNSVSVIDTKNSKVIETLNAALFPNSLSGSTTNGVALSDDEKTLFIANADNNCLSVFDVSQLGNSKSLGFIPVGWYPTNVKVIGNKILVSNGKGFTSMANPNGPNPMKRKQKVKAQQGDAEKPKEVQYIAGLFKGTLSFISIPNEQELSAYSKQVYENIPYNKDKESVSIVESGNTIPRHVGDASPIKYVFYIVKENRTYDQVMGDVAEGNGDTSLVLFGRNITPNQHALAKEFVLLDNFYVDGEVSADGHNWSLGAYATDFLEKTWPTSYGNRGGDYDAEGNRNVANNKNGFIWDYCKRAGVSYRTYGEFADKFKPNIPVLKNHFCPYYTSWDQSVKDTTRFYEWKREFDSLLGINAVPQLNTFRFINDHTEGLKFGKPTPFANVADNDLATGMFVEYLSKSSIWNNSVVFIVEDDAQNGPDHVDAHRSTAFVAGGYVKRNFIDHTMYSTSSMLRTIELILGLPPMSQYDAAAQPMWRCFSNTIDAKPFNSLPEKIDLEEKNTAFNILEKRSSKFDFSKEDLVPDYALNEVLWKSIKGLNSMMPSPKHSGFFKPIEKDKD